MATFIRWQVPGPRNECSTIVRARLGMRILRVVTTVLLMLTVAFVAIAAEEWRMYAATTQAFSVTPLYGSRTIEFGALVVSLTDAGGDVDDSRDSDLPIEVRVNGKLVAAPLPGRVRRALRGADRYAREVQAFLVQRLRDGTRRVAVAQHVHPSDKGRAGEGMLCRLLWIERDGSVTEEYASESDWNRAGLSTLLMGYVTPHAMGYRTNLLQGDAGLVFPILVPYVSGLGGLCGLIALFWFRRKPS